VWKGRPSPGSHQCLCFRSQLYESHDQWCQCLLIAFFSLLLDAPSLPAFLGSKSTRETAKENFSAALEDYATGVQQAMAQEMLQDYVVALHQEQGKHFKAYEAAIVATLNTNHACCNDLLKKKDDANSRWDRHCMQLRQGILSEEVTVQ
jgi:hypothetical protein